MRKGDLFITAEDIELVNLLKTVEKNHFSIGKDVGIISYNDDPIKEILYGGITTLSSDFRAMGKSLAELVTNKEKRNIPNPCHLTIRRSL